MRHLVWTVWALLVVVDMAYVYRYGSNVPSWDDWDMVPTMTGRQPITAEWLWSQHNEHRIPVPRLAMLAVYRVRPDFRATMAVNVLLMAWLAAALIRCAERVRGAPAFTDAFFPLALLGLAQGLNFIWGWQLEFMASTALAGAVLLCIAGYRAGEGRRIAWVTGVCLILLALSGAHGLAVVPALAVWLLALAIWGEPRNRLLIFGLCGACAALTAVYLVGYQPVPHHPKTTGPLFTIKTMVQVLTMAWGPAVKTIWPVSGLLTVFALAAAAVLCLRVAITDPKERVRAAGHLCFLGAMATLGLAIGLGRSGFEPRYITLSVPVVCSLYLIALTYLPPAWQKRSGWLLLGASIAAVPANTASGLEYGRWLRGHLGTFEDEMRAGTPQHVLIQRHHRELYPQQQLIADYLPMLRDAKIGAFAKLASDPPFREIVQPEWRNQTVRTNGEEFATFRLPEEAQAAGIRVRFTAENRRRVPPFFRIEWGENKSYAIWPTGDRANWERGSWTRIGQPYTELTVWIGDRVREIRIYPDIEPCVLQLVELAVLVQ